jgi:hypothetical protein
LSFGGGGLVVLELEFGEVEASVAISGVSNDALLVGLLLLLPVVGADGRMRRTRCGGSMEECCGSRGRGR